jgi:hypothetical protein
MISFEYVAALLLEDEGYWTRTRVKVLLSKQEKRDLGNPSMPRPEVDVIAFKPKTNEVRLVECKSYLDSGGVSVKHLTLGSKDANRLKFFNNRPLRELVERRVLEKLAETGSLGESQPRILWELFAGRLKRGEEEIVERMLLEGGWLLRRPGQIADALRQFAERGYEDEVATVVTKLLERNSSENTGEH